MPGFAKTGMQPPAFAPAFGDHMAGMCLTFGVMSALLGRERSGEGQRVEVSLFHAGVYQLSFDYAGTLATKQDWLFLNSREEREHQPAHAAVPHPGRPLVAPQCAPA